MATVDYVDPRQHRRRLQCTSCKQILPGTHYTYFQFSKWNVIDRRCKLCTIQAREARRTNAINRGDVVRTTIPLWKAVQTSNFLQIMYLLERGNTKLGQRCPETGRSAIHWAAIIGDADICELLCEYGANVTEKSFVAGDTALHYAALTNHPKICFMLLSFGADVDARNLQKQTAVYYVTSVETAEVFMRASADLSVVDKAGRKPIAFIRQQEHEEAADYMDGVQVERIVAKQERIEEKEQGEQERRKEIEEKRETTMKTTKARNVVARATAEYKAWRKPVGVRNPDGTPVDLSENDAPGTESASRKAKNRQEPARVITAVSGGVDFSSRKWAVKPT